MEAARAASRRPRRRPPRYSALALLRHGLSGRDWPRAWPDQPLRNRYDVVIVGGGVHGLAAAYYLAVNHGITDVAVLDKGYIGGGGSGRSTAILRSNYLTPEGVRFYDRSMQLYRTLAADLDFNVMFSRRGHLTLAHNDSSLRTMRWRAEVNQLQGVDSEVIDPGEIKRLVPYLDTSAHTRYPILGALYHPPGGIIRHDAVVWGYARAAAAQGVHIHQDTEVTGIDVADGRVRGVRTTKGDIATPVVLNATAGWSTLVAAMAGVRLPIATFPLQAAVTEPVRPFLHAVVVSGTLHVYVSQTDRGELVFGASVDPFAAYSTRGTLEFAEGLATHVIELMPGLSKMRLLRQWSGLCDMTPDFSPIMGGTGVEGFYVDVGWGTYGFKAGPVSGEAMARCIADGRAPEIIEAFGIGRFGAGELVGEKGAAAVGHLSGGRRLIMILIRCPWCGPRDAGEFHYSGEVTPRPDPATATPEQWRDYLYFPANPRGQVTETWYHRMGCRKFFVLQRDTDTNESRPLDGPGGIGGDQGFVPPGASRAGQQ